MQKHERMQVAFFETRTSSSGVPSRRRTAATATLSSSSSLASRPRRPSSRAGSRQSAASSAIGSTILRCLRSPISGSASWRCDPPASTTSIWTPPTGSASRSYACRSFTAPVAERAIGLILTLNRKIHRAYARVREGNFSLEGLVGFDLFEDECGVLGTGKVGAVAAELLLGFGCRVLAYDATPVERLAARGVEYADLARIYAESDVLSLHLPLTPGTHHLVDQDAFDRMKKGVLLVNTGRGALVDSRALIKALKSGKVGSAALDVYEEEEGVFSGRGASERYGIQNEVLARLLTFPNVLMTAHQGFLTREALSRIADVAPREHIGLRARRLPEQQDSHRGARAPRRVTRPNQAACRAHSAVGMVKWKLHVAPGLLSTHMRPPCASTRPRQM